MPENNNPVINAANLAADVLTDVMYGDAAKEINCDIPSIKAVEEVESNGKAFLADGRLPILFEGHQFWKALERRKYNVVALADNPTYSNVLYKHWDKTKYKGGAKEWDRLQLACTIDKEAAFESASFGAFQIMGFNYKICGFKSVFEMVDFMKVNKYNQLICFLRYVKAAGLDKALRLHRWPVFAEGYNGPGYKGNPFTTNDDYDLKLAKAYAKYS